MTGPSTLRGVPHGIEHDRRDRHGILAVFGRDVLSSPPAERRRWLDRAFRYWRDRGFPFPQTSHGVVRPEFRRLLSAAPHDILRHGSLMPSTIGLRVANAFHPQIWHVKMHGVSAVERFQDDSVLRSVLLKTLRFWPNRRCWNAQCVRSLMRIHHRARVANFRPTAAKAVIHHFSADGSRVLDFSAGFGGRLLGALALNRHYIGVDPARSQACGLTRMVRALAGVARGTAEVHRACAEDLLPLMPARSVDLVFSSPPYFNLERYGAEATQSYKRYPRYVEWRERFLAVVIREACRVLRHGGCLAINVADTRNFPIARDTLAIARRELRLVRRLRLVMNAAPAARARGRLYRYEPVYVFQKRCP
jgi:SAM-dependent methyltransferase